MANQKIQTIYVIATILLFIISGINTREFSPSFPNSNTLKVFTFVYAPIAIFTHFFYVFIVRKLPKSRQIKQERDV